MKTGIYLITNVKTNKNYVGQARDIRQRKNNHFNKLKHNIHKNTYMQRAYNKYGIESFSFKILEECKLDVIDEREIYWIEIYDSLKNGYNNIPGGKCARGFKRSEEQKLKMSLSRKGVKTKPCSEEKKEKIRQTNLNAWMNEELLKNHRINNIGEKNPMYNKKPWNYGIKMSIEEIEKNRNSQLKKHKDELYSYEMVRRRTTITDNEAIKILEMLKKGYNVFYISKSLNVSHKAVDKLNKRIGGYGVWASKIESGVITYVQC